MGRVKAPCPRVAARPPLVHYPSTGGAAGSPAEAVGRRSVLGASRRGSVGQDRGWPPRACIQRRQRRRSGSSTAVPFARCNEWRRAEGAQIGVLTGLLRRCRRPAQKDRLTRLPRTLARMPGGRRHWPQRRAGTPARRAARPGARRPGRWRDRGARATRVRGEHQAARHERRLGHHLIVGQPPGGRAVGAHGECLHLALQQDVVQARRAKDGDQRRAGLDVPGEVARPYGEAVADEAVAHHQQRGGVQQDRRPARRRWGTRGGSST